MTERITADRASQPCTRLAEQIPGSRLWGWAGPLLVTGLGAFLRFYRLGVPHAVVFDETYYVPDAWSILRHGVEINHFSTVNKLLARGSTHILMGTQGEYVAHPPLGKIMIAVGEWLFGLTPFGWRFSVAVVGSLAILMTARIARRMTRSTALGCVAGFLLAIDGLEFVLSRTAILDIFVMFWVLAAFGLILIDRDRTRNLLAAAAERAGPDGPLRSPGLGIRWLLAGAGVCLGLACATKWNGVWYLIIFPALVIAWDLRARREAGLPSRWRSVLRANTPLLPVWFGIAPLVAYVVSWTGWFATSYGFDRNGAALNGGRPASTLVAWLQYQKSMLGFGLGLKTYQTYQSNPLGWLVLARPISFYWNCEPASQCAHSPTARSTAQEVLAIGTPLIWWGGTIALAVCAIWWLRRRDWRAGAVLLGVAAGWLPWIWFYWHDHRTEFFYYAVVFDPFLVIGIALCIGLIVGPAGPSGPVRPAGLARRRRGMIITGTYLALAAANFWFMYPVLAAQVISHGAWVDRMWFGSWI